MKNKLRLGNLILGEYYNEDTEQEEYYECEVVLLDSTGSCDFAIMVDSKTDIEEFNSFQGISLTEEWLLKFGFEIEKDNAWYRKGCISVNTQNGYIHFDHSSTDIHEYFTLPTANCKFVHTLQNLYFALTGEELKLKETVS